MKSQEKTIMNRMLAVLSLVGMSCFGGEVVSAGLAPGEPEVTTYRVTANGKPVAIYRSMADDEYRQGYQESYYYFGSFDFSGECRVEVTSSVSLKNVQILPARFGLVPKVSSDGGKLEFVASKPFRISIERSGKEEALLLFGNALETDAPKAGDPGVVYFGPGQHKAGKIELTSNQTLYLAAGAVVNGAIVAKGDNITIRGRGILGGEAYPRFKGPSGWMLELRDGKNVVVKDIIVRNPWSWILVTAGCDGVLVDGVKIAGSRMINDDAIDLCNTKNVVIKNCFLRTRDDIIAIKGLGAGQGQACENIFIQDSEFWTDNANIYRIGFECDAKEMKNIRSKNIDVLHYSQYSGPQNFWSHAIFWLQPSGGMTLSDTHFEDFRIYCDGRDMMLLCAKMMLTSCHGKSYEVSGRVRNCSLKDIAVIGTQGEFRGQIHLSGRSSDEDVQGIRLENITYFGKRITLDSPCVEILKYVEGVEFK